MDNVEILHFNDELSGLLTKYGLTGLVGVMIDNEDYPLVIKVGDSDKHSPYYETFYDLLREMAQCVTGSQITGRVTGKYYGKSTDNTEMPH